jgi:hypothetical protein
VSIPAAAPAWRAPAAVSGGLECRAPDAEG